MSKTGISNISGRSKNFEKGTEDNLSVASSFIANAQNELYAFYTENGGFLKNSELIGAAAPTAPPLNPPLSKSTCLNFETIILYAHTYFC